MQLTTESITAMTPGAKLNRAVHEVALGRIGRAKPYSTDSAVAAELIDLLPIFGARVAKGAEGYDEVRPYIAGTMAFHPALDSFVTVIRVRCATLPIALCKAALLYSILPRDRPPAPTSTAMAPLGFAAAPKLEKMPARLSAPILPVLAPPADAPESEA